jgi:hypothetical protein
MTGDDRLDAVLGDIGRAIMIGHATGIHPMDTQEIWALFGRLMGITEPDRTIVAAVATIIEATSGAHPWIIEVITEHDDTPPTVRHLFAVPPA